MVGGVGGGGGREKTREERRREAVGETAFEDIMRVENGCEGVVVESSYDGWAPQLDGSRSRDDSSGDGWKFYSEVDGQLGCNFVWRSASSVRSPPSTTTAGEVLFFTFAEF